MTPEPAARPKPKASRIIGIDYGMVRFGIAISDEQKIIAIPSMTITAEKKSEATAFKIVQELLRHATENGYRIEEIVIGLPLMMSGKKGMVADEVSHFIELLRQNTEITIIPWDERLTTVQAERSMREGSLTRKRRSKIVDKVAATIILQSYLDRRGIGKTQNS